jgi:drug/metabolite transporter (DMT)-like permease
MTSLFLAILCSSSLALILKAADSTGNRYGILLGNYIICAVIALVSCRFRIVLTPVTAALGILGGFLFLFGLLAMQESISVNGASLTAAFSKLGMIVSLLISVIFFHETLRPLPLAGILLAVPAIFIIHHGKRDTAGAKFSLLLLTLLGNGLADSMARFFQAFGSPTQEESYLFVLFFTAGILTLILAVREWNRTNAPIAPHSLLYGAIAGIPNYYSSLFLIHALAALPAVIVYPVFSVGTILTVTTISALLFHERIDRVQKAGLILILSSLVLLNL